jgi:hypothetical protein
MNGEVPQSILEALKALKAEEKRTGEIHDFTGIVAGTKFNILSMW